MRTSAFLFVIAVLAATGAHAQQRIDATIIVDGVERSFIVVRPSGPTPAGGFPLVVMFHGSSGDGERFYNISGWKEIGEREKIVTVFPSSLEYCVEEDGVQKRTTKWNNGELVRVACPGQTLKNDVTFVRAMIDTIEKVIAIDPARRFASGFSNGGIFASKLAIEASDIFSAVAASAGPLNDLDSATPVRNIPLALTIGSIDDRATTAFGITELPMNDSVFLYMGSFVRRMLGAFRLSDVHATRRTPLTLSYIWTTPLEGAPPATVTFTLMKDLGHQYPNGTNHPIVAASVFWQFFQTGALPSSSPDEALPATLDLTLRGD